MTLSFGSWAPHTARGVFLEYWNEGQFSGPLFPTVTIPPGEEEMEDTTQHDRCAVTQDQRKCNNSTEPWLGGGKVPTVHKTQRREREKERDREEEGVIQSHQRPHSQDRAPQLWTTNEISKSWVRYLFPVELSVRQRRGETKRGMRVWAEKTSGAPEWALHLHSFRSEGRERGPDHNPPCNFPSTLIPLMWGVHEWSHTHTHAIRPQTHHCQSLNLPGCTLSFTSIPMMIPQICGVLSYLRPPIADSHLALKIKPASRRDWWYWLIR